jgi:hypothetical protein
VGINPTVSDWLPGDDSEKLLNGLIAQGVTGIWLAALHFNMKQLRVMPQRDKDLLGMAVLDKGLRNAKDLQQGCFDFIDRIKGYAQSVGLAVEGLFEGERNTFFDPFKRVYKKLFPTVHDFINWCHDNKADGAPVYYEEFKAVMTGFPGGKFNVSPYMRCMSQTLDADVRKSAGYKHTYEWMLRLAWNETRMKRMLNRYWAFAVGVHYDENKDKEMRYQEDAEGNVVYYFKRAGWDDDFEIVGGEKQKVKSRK